MYIYKIVSKNDWDKCREQDFLMPQPLDKEFIHCCEYEQINRIIDKFWQNIEVVILKLDSSKLVGDLIKESNPGGTTQYYHLYNGKIPISSVVEVLHSTVKV